MATEIELKEAAKIYELAGAAFDDMELKYKRNDENLLLCIGEDAEDNLSMIVLQVVPEKSLVTILFYLPYVPEDKRIDYSLAVSTINEDLVDGSFDFNVLTGDAVFRITTSYKNSELSKDVFYYMFCTGFNTVIEYLSMLEKLGNGETSIAEFVEWMIISGRKEIENGN